jgi:hypothetical protein
MTVLAVVGGLAFAANGDVQQSHGIAVLVGLGAHHAGGGQHNLQDSA